MKDLLRRCQFPLMLTLGTCPLAPVLYNAAGGTGIALSWIFPALYLILGCGAMMVPGKGRLAFGIAGCVGLLAVGVALWDGQILKLLVPVCYGALLFGTLPMGGWAWDREPSGFWLCGGAAVHLVGQFALLADKNVGSGTMQWCAGFILAAFLGYVLLVMLSLNRRNLNAAAAGAGRTPGGIRRKNYVLILAVFLVAMGIALLPALGSAVAALWAWVGKLIVQFSDLFGGDSQSSQFEQENNMVTVPRGETSPLAEILGQIVGVAAQIAIVVIALVLLWRLVRWIWKTMSRTWDQMNRFAESASADYQDEITDTRDPDDQKSAAFGRRRVRLPAENEPGISPRQRIRRRYLRLRVKNGDWDDAATARENLSREAADLYERARYSDHPMTEAEASSFRSQTGGKDKHG